MDEGVGKWYDIWEGTRTMIRLEEINGKNVWDILKLRVSDAQKSFVAPNDVSIIEAYIAITHHGQAECGD